MRTYKNAGAARPRHMVACTLISVALVCSPSIGAVATLPLLFIKGIAPNAVVGHAYYFRPTAHNPNGLPMRFAVADKPDWATFDPVTGALSGTPTLAGTYANISIRVTDGDAKAFMPAFAIVVENPTNAGTATLSWVPPTETTIGGTLANLAGYRIYYGASPDTLTQTVNIANPGVTRFVIAGLGAATWYFQMTAYDSNGMESPPTELETLLIQ